MRWPWLRDEEKVKQEADETDLVRARLQLVMEDLRKTLSDVEQVIKQREVERGTEGGR